MFVGGELGAFGESLWPMLMCSAVCLAPAPTSQSFASVGPHRSCLAGAAQAGRGNGQIFSRTQLIHEVHFSDAFRPRGSIDFPASSSARTLDTSNSKLLTAPKWYCLCSQMADLSHPHRGTVGTESPFMV